MAREQMMCFITPAAAGASLDVSAAALRRIDALCEATGRIHYATLALLPPLSDAPPDTPPAWMLEVVADEGVSTPELVDLLLTHGFGVLWWLCRAHWRGPRGTPPAGKRDWLRAFLLQHANRAACGFVGNRDRNLAQVRGERAFLQDAEAAFRALPPSRVPDRDALAAEMRAWAREAGGAWTAEPPPRSFWRRGTVPDGVRIALLAVRLVVPALAVLGLFTVIGAIVLCAAWLLTGNGLDVPDFVASAVLLGVLGLVAVLLPVVFGAMAGGVALVAAFAVLLVFVLGLALLALGSVLAGALWIPACMGALTALGAIALVAIGLVAALLVLACAASRLRAPPFFPLGLAAVAGAALVLLAFGFTAWMFRVMGRLDCGLPPLHLSAWPDPLTALCWTAAALCVVGTGLLAGPRLFGFLGSQLGRRMREADRPVALPDVPLHTVHPSVQSCEAAIAQRTGHMISLTDIRSPLHRHGLRFWLGFINLLGELYFTEGRLGNAGGIHFGHWHIVDGGRRLLFCSNFDGSFGGYLDGFIRGAAQGVNLIWRGTELRVRPAARPDQPAVLRARSFPPTRLHIFCGCKCEQAFKSYARDSMLPHLHRWEAYTLSNEDIARATRLRTALQGRRTAVKDDQIARIMES
ncbi:MAG: hypothetical protein EOO26_06525 [Comamonadaceae bacterium]|nr:MAG: hypothetical protein EOO26_06525 [Comamonadaceae bacterium]